MKESYLWFLTKGGRGKRVTLEKSDLVLALVTRRDLLYLTPESTEGATPDASTSHKTWPGGADKGRLEPTDMETPAADASQCSITITQDSNQSMDGPE
ncbi:hypothetical protein ElyMa_003814500 [Elysia marginata]|uniref:Uncharacterized protein n=1 Tax=Elysia marginata TaxID=1093978 RepID=A0AAV4FEY4_9GAST|nr:hypothetical protein ElyMa_003814500 [Elysia marginata]